MQTQKLVGLPLLLASLALVPTATCQKDSLFASKTASKGWPAPTTNPVQAEAPAADYILGGGDLLHIAVWKEPELTQNAVIRPDGKISFPLIGEVSVAGLSVVDAQHLLADKLHTILAAPQVMITVSEIHSRQVYITGEVGHPGAYPLPSTMNVLQLIASAGGLTEYAHKKGIYILRTSIGHPLRFNYSEVSRGKQNAQNIDLIPGDTVVIP